MRRPYKTWIVALVLFTLGMSAPGAEAEGINDAGIVPDLELALDDNEQALHTYELAEVINLTDSLHFVYMGETRASLLSVHRPLRSQRTEAVSFNLYQLLNGLQIGGPQDGTVTVERWMKNPWRPAVVMRT